MPAMLNAETWKKAENDRDARTECRRGLLEKQDFGLSAQVLQELAIAIASGKMKMRTFSHLAFSTSPTQHSLPQSLTRL